MLAVRASTNVLRAWHEPCLERTHLLPPGTSLPPPRPPPAPAQVGEADLVRVRQTYLPLQHATNIYAAPYVPLHTLLAHPKIVSFIADGSVQSVYAGLTHGKVRERSPPPSPPPARHASLAAACDCAGQALPACLPRGFQQTVAALHGI